MSMINFNLRMVFNIEKPTYYPVNYWFNCNQLIREPLQPFWAVTACNKTLFFLSERFDELNWLLLLKGLGPDLEKVHIEMLCLSWHFRHEYFSEHVFAKCPSFKHTKQSHFCLINFLRAEVSEIKRHLFGECFEPQNTHDVVLLLFTKDLWFEYSADEFLIWKFVLLRINKWCRYR